MNKKKSPKSNLPILKSYPEEIYMILKFFAISDTIDDALNEFSFKRRLNVIPHAVTGLKMMNGRMIQLLYDLVATLPKDKRKSILRTASHMKYKVYLNTPVIKEDDAIIISNEDLSLLCSYAHQNCNICFEKNCNNCKLGKVFDRVMAYSRDEDESWVTWEGWVDIEGTD